MQEIETLLLRLPSDTGLDILLPMIKGKKLPVPAEDPPPEKPISFEGRSLEDIRDFPPGAKEDCGYQLYKVQIGDQPDNYRPMPRVGQGVEEIRIHDDDGIYRVIFTARFDEAVYVLHAFEKRTQQTSDKDIDLAKDRLKKVLAKRQQAATAAKKGSK